MHSVIRRLNLAMTRSHFPLGMLWTKSLCDLWSSSTLCGVLVYTFYLQCYQRTKSRVLRSGEPGDHTKSFHLDMILPFFKIPQDLIRHVRCRTVLLKPQRFKIKIFLTQQQNIKGVYYPSISFLYNCNSRVIFFKPQWTNYPGCTDSAPCCNLALWSGRPLTLFGGSLLHVLQLCELTFSFR